MCGGNMSDDKRKMRVYERDNIYPQSLSFYLPLFEYNINKFKYVANHWEVGCFKDGYFWWARDVDFLEKSFRSWFSEWLKDDKFREDLFKKFESDYKNFIDRFWEMKKGCQDLSNTELFQFYNEVVVLVLDTLEYSEYTVDMFDDFFGKIFSNYLSSFKKDIAKDDFQDFFVPASFSTSQQYEQCLLELSLLNSRKVDFPKLIDKFSWIQMSWDGDGELTIDEIKKELGEKIKLDTKERKKQLQNLKTYTETVQEKRKSLIEKYSLNAREIGLYFQLLDRFTTFHDYRKEIQMRGNQLIYSALRETSDRFSLEYKDLLFYLNEEVENLLLKNKKVKKETLDERKKGMTWYIKDGKVKKYFSKKAMEMLEELVLSQIKVQDQDRVEGFPANPGRYEGKVFMVKDAKQAVREIEEGDILVTSMTTVDFLPAMKKAGAIITDDGGVTCHAAIVSRELDVPCVVGTKISTQVFKTGDKVAVDAYLGNIKKII